jgi:hypothetical protein
MIVRTTARRYRGVFCALVALTSSLASSAARADTLANCAQITAPGSYVVTADLSGIGPVACIAIANTTQVTLDCQGHTLGHPTNGVSVVNTSNYSIKNCNIPTGVAITNSTNGTFSGSTVGASPSSTQAIQVTQSRALTVASNTLFARYAQTYSSGTTITGNSFAATAAANLVTSAFGRSTAVLNNTLDGGGGTTDGVLLMDERDDRVAGNAIQNVSNSGVQVQGELASSTIANNTVANATFGFGGWNWLSFLDNDVTGNTITGSAVPFEFARSCGLRSVGWNGRLGGPGLANADIGVFFSGNNFDRNSFINPSVTGCGGIRFLNNGSYLDYDHTICNGGAPETFPLPSQFFLQSNAFSNNDFGAMQCLPGPDFGEPAVPGAVLDRGNNACQAGPSTDYPLHCVAASVPPPPPLNTVDVVSSTQAGGALACNGSADGQGTGLAYSGSNVFGPDPRQDWRYVLALVYGGLDITTGVVDCGQAARSTLVSSWTSLFQNSCGNDAGVCSDAAHGGALWRAFRLDDSSAVSSVFAALVGLSPAPSASALNGFGVSPYCNAMNWDTTGANANCGLGAHNQWTGPGGVDDPASTTSPKRRRPPPGTWGDNPDPSQPALGADVLPTSFQDNDPIRRACLGGATNNPQRTGEEVCNIDGTLGLVVPIPDSSFLTTQTPPLAQYPTNACNTFLLGKPPTVFTCAVRGTGTRHSGECPNGDGLIAGGCLVPLDTASGTSQCVATRATVPALQSRSVGTADGRSFNVFMLDGTVTEPTIGYAKRPITAGSTALLDFVGGYGRIHQVETVFATGASPLVPCHRAAATDQIGCLAQADPCSIGVAGDGARMDTTGGADALRVSQEYASSAPYPLVCPNGVACQF